MAWVNANLCKGVSGIDVLYSEELYGYFLLDDTEWL